MITLNDLIQQKNDLEDENQQLRSLLSDALEMLEDLHNNFGWDELHCTLEDLKEAASEAGVEVASTILESEAEKVKWIIHDREKKVEIINRMEESE